MKKYLLFCLFSIVGFVAVMAQNYAPFPTSNAIWREEHLDNTAVLNIIQDKYQYIQTTDTVIGSLTYHKLYYSGIQILYNNLGVVVDTILTAPQYKGALRENSKKIYFFPAGQPAEKVLYDFNLQEGDTIPGLQYGYAYGYTPRVDSIRTIVTADGVTRKKYFLSVEGSYDETTFWIEGVGCGMGLLPRYELSSGNVTQLLCFQANNTPIWYETAASQCGLVQVANEKPLIKIGKVAIVPNPLVQDSRLEMAENIHDFQLEVIDIMGNVVKSEWVENQFDFQLKRNDFAVGMYIVKLQTKNNQVFVGKMLVQ